MQSFELKLEDGKWLNPPANYNINEASIALQTEPSTDFWQRSYYGFQNDNAPAYLFESDKNFTFTVKADFTYKKLFDQCGIVIYLNSENWFKASIEYENDEFSRLGSVVTNNGYSDWATTDISHVSTIWYRLSRRGPDFLVESSMDGITFRQMRVLHLHSLGATTPEMGAANPPLPAEQSIAFGVYACSPVDSSFSVEFSEVSFTPCTWEAHSVD
jgi:regulation of enolase protein 1 (concanavalin A-like superfamily)